MSDYIDSKNLDPQTREHLLEVLKKEEAALTPDDVEFLRAREMYIKDKHKEAYPNVFDPKQIKKAAKEAQQEQPEPENPNPNPPVPMEDDEDGEDEDQLPG